MDYNDWYICRNFRGNVSAKLKSHNNGKSDKTPWTRAHLKIPGRDLYGNDEDLYVVPRHENQSNFQSNKVYESHIEVSYFYCFNCQL